MYLFICTCLSLKSFQDMTSQLVRQMHRPCIIVVLKVSNLIKIRSFDPLLIDPSVVIYEEGIKGSNFN